MVQLVLEQILLYQIHAFFGFVFFLVSIFYPPSFMKNSGGK